MYQELAFQIAKKAHAGQVDKAGKDYILHPMTSHLIWIQIRKKPSPIYMIY